MMTHQNKPSAKISELLSEWLSQEPCQDVRVSGISEYSPDTQMGDLFLAITDSRYVDHAISMGAVAIVCDNEINTAIEALIEKQQLNIPVFSIPDLSAHKHQIIERFYQQKNHLLQTVAITGTDGKTSVAHLLVQALDTMGGRNGLIGTLGCGYLNALTSSHHTTPSTARIAREYQQFDSDGCKVVAIEASSHGIKQQRLKNTPIHTAVLTNITRDHLDYHKTIKDYVQAKAQLFFTHHPENAVINIDDDMGKQWVQELGSQLNIITFSADNPKADISLKQARYRAQGMDIEVSLQGKNYHLSVSLYGPFNVLNILAVMAVLKSLGKSDIQIIRALEGIQSVPGRMQSVKNEKMRSVFVDYAHTPAALLAAINAVREHCNGRLICVFGCGGDRDQGKRSQMGEVASRYADEVIITSDNPRHEKPQDIIDAIVNGCVSRKNVHQIELREQAIAYALETSQVHDAILIAGKGHEKLQFIGDQAIAFDDVLVAQQTLHEVAYG
jgi:UDP-N-acetylmuramoyl-L-alanyl-D-glutamate--2,6-diaminopimelate ligase